MCWQNVYISRSGIKMLVLCTIFYSFSKKDIHIHVWAMKYQLCNFGDSAYQFNALIFAFKTGIAQYKQ